MRKIIGYIMLLSPFIALFSLAVTYDELETFFISIAFSLAIVAIVYLGLYLIIKED